MKHFLFALLFLSCLYSFAQKPKNFTVVIDDLTARLENAHMSAQPMRLAIVPFGNTQSQTSNRFGDYITESIIGKLNPGKYKIFERKRLDAILREDELMLSDLMLPEAAQKIGKLVPIDALFSGTYTRLKTYIDVSARLIDVTSGEILVSFSGRIKMTKNLKILFPANEPPAPDNSMTINLKSTPVKTEAVNKKSKEDLCKERSREFEVRLNDLSSDEKINAVTKEALAVPFENNECGRIHFDVMYYFTRYKIKRPEYETFLLATLDSIALPNFQGDDRAYSIVKFIARDSVIDEREWKIGLHTITKVGDYSISTFLGFLIGKTKSPDDEVHNRIDTYFRLAADHKIGLPTAISSNQAFFEMMRGLRYNNRKFQPYTYEKYSSIITLDTRSASSVYSELETMFKEENQRAVKTKIMGWLIDFFNNHVDEKSGEHLFDLAFSSQPTANDDRNAKIINEFPASDLALLVDRCRGKFSEYAMKVPYKSQQEDRINFCIKYDIPIPGVIPSLTEAEIILKGNDLVKQLDVMKMLVQMGTRPKSLEATLTALFSKRSLEDKEMMTDVQVLAIKTLGNIRTTQPVAINYMVSKLRSYNYAESDNSSAALVQIGKPSVAPLISLLNSTNNQDGGLRYKIVVILGKIGPGARSAETSLKKLLTETTNSDVRYAIEAALERIR